MKIGLYCHPEVFLQLVLAPFETTPRFSGKCQFVCFSVEKIFSSSFDTSLILFVPTGGLFLLGSVAPGNFVVFSSGPQSEKTSRPSHPSRSSFCTRRDLVQKKNVIQPADRFLSTLTHVRGGGGGARPQIQSSYSEEKCLK